MQKKYSIKTKPNHSKVISFIKQVVVIASALVLISIAILVIFHRNPAPVIPADSQAAPSSIKPSIKAVTSYSVPATDPEYISIPAINVPLTRVLKLGLTSNNQIAVPNNIYDTGWYDGSSKPGQTGAMFIYGHVSNWTADGIFYNLKKLQAGDTVTITRGDAKKFTYVVVSSKVYNYKQVDMNQVLSPVNANKPALNLMTCTGTVIPGTSEFNERLVVFTSLE